VPPLLQAWLRSGVVLCELLNAIAPSAVAPPSASALRFPQMGNITAYTQACRDVLGVAEVSLFVTVDLFDSRDMGAVLRNLREVARLAAERGFAGPRLADFAQFGMPEQEGDTHHHQRSGDGHSEHRHSSSRHSHHHESRHSHHHHGSSHGHGDEKDKTTAPSKTAMAADAVLAAGGHRNRPDAPAGSDEKKKKKKKGFAAGIFSDRGGGGGGARKSQEKDTDKDTEKDKERGFLGGMFSERGGAGRKRPEGFMGGLFSDRSGGRKRGSESPPPAAAKERPSSKGGGGGETKVEVEARPTVEATLEPKQQQGGGGGGGGLSSVAAFIGESVEKAINVAEDITGIDLDMDGDVGLAGQAGQAGQAAADAKGDGEGKEPAPPEEGRHHHRHHGESRHGSSRHGSSHHEQRSTPRKDGDGAQREESRHSCHHGSHHGSHHERHSSGGGHGRHSSSSSQGSSGGGSHHRHGKH